MSQLLFHKLVLGTADSLHLKQTTPEMHNDIIIILVETIRSQITDCGVISNGTLLCIPGVQKLWNLHKAY